MERIIFIYHKDGVLKSLSLNQAKLMNDKMIKDGWAHTQTIDPCAFIDYLFNECSESDVLTAIKELPIPLNPNEP